MGEEKFCTEITVTFRVCGSDKSQMLNRMHEAVSCAEYTISNAQYVRIEWGKCWREVVIGD